MNTYSMPSTNSIGEKVLNFFSRDIQVFRQKLSDKKRERFYSELNILLTAGIDLKTAMEIVVEEQTNSQNKKTFLLIKDDLVRGKSLSKSIEDTGEFSPYEYYSIMVGEE